MPTATLATPIGFLTVEARDGAITGLGWGKGPDSAATAELDEACAQIRAYFNGRLRAFDLPLRVEGTAFQRRVCAAMCAIPCGETRRYGDLAADLGAPARAVGQACGANPIPVIIPCHRVVAARSMGGYSGAGGIESKIWLLRHEGAGGLLI